MILNLVRRSHLIALAVATLAACSVQPRDLHLGAEACEHCHMVIDDLRFAAQALSSRGQVFTFDALECMAEWVHRETLPANQLHSLWVSDFAAPGQWIRAEDAHFLRNPGLHSPMGAGLAGFATLASARSVQGEIGGQILTWAEVVNASGSHP